MAEIVVRDLPPDLVKRLRKQAKAHRRTLQAELKSILEGATVLDKAATLDLADRMRAMLGRRFDDSAVLIREERDR